MIKAIQLNKKCPKKVIIFYGRMQSRIYFQLGYLQSKGRGNVLTWTNIRGRGGGVAVSIKGIPQSPVYAKPDWRSQFG